MGKHANLKSQIAAFMTPYKLAEFETFASAGNSRKALLLCQLKATSSEEVLLNFLNLMNVKVCVVPRLQHLYLCCMACLYSCEMVP